jgi:hypothetical protein
MCEGWSLALGEEHGLRAIDHRVLRKIPGLERNEATGGRRTLYSDESYGLYFTSSIIKSIMSRRMWWTEDVACMRRGVMHTEF